MTTTFQVGQTYFTRSICDYDTVFAFEVLNRTAKTITIKAGGKTVKRGVRIVDGLEQCYPLGRYSMAPVITAWSSVDTLSDRVA